ncbi:TetR/AcrR family transcriptional regulator [Shimazuella sp. AN120528]|uniref:TetR/AcrR family transcriptional regulator n=1 Tax=Shimazuella soli TaxID=1892854 RepID=UPI001F0E4C25|nr:TetR/AcrR family transcriptional regulator [Shimazuella soli]MCH5584058.1 TetR/AcrR family transcriptional regulator [Shimazuella soli]
MNSKTKLSWLKEGCAVLAEAGPDELTIDGLCRRLKLTKGSFYHHFKNRKDYIHALLQFWEENMTLKLIDLSQREGSAREQLDRLTELVINLLAESSLEVNIRAWASHDELVYSYQQRVDIERRNSVKVLCDNIYKENIDSDLVAKIYYTLFIGSQHLFPPLNKKELTLIYKNITHILGN